MNNSNEITSLEQIQEFIFTIIKISNIIKTRYSSNNMSTNAKILLADLKFKLLATATMIDSHSYPKD